MQPKQYLRAARASACAAIVVLGNTAAAVAETPLAASGDERYAIRAVFTVGEHEERIYDGVIHLTWTDFGPDGMNLVTCQFESLNADVTFSDGRNQYECRREGGEGVLPMSEGWSDEALAGVRFLVSSPLEILLDNDGRIERIAGMQRISLMSEMIGEEIDDALGPFTPEQIARTLEPIFHADGASAPASDSWESPREWTLGGSRTLTLLGSWRLDSVADDIATFSADLQMQVDPGDDASALSPVVEIADFEGEASASWDLAAGALIQREQSLRFSAAWSVREVSESVGVTSNVTIARVESEPESD